MAKRITLFVVAAGSLLAFNGPVSGQEVNSDVSMPPPRELVGSTPAINGLFVGPDSLFWSEDQVFRGSLARASVGILDETQTRRELGNFMASLMVRAGIVAFDRPPARLADSEGSARDGARPAWTGPTPTVHAVSRRGRSQWAQRR